jgi:hypothetical protein
MITANKYDDDDDDDDGNRRRSTPPIIINFLDPLSDRKKDMTERLITCDIPNRINITDPVE